MRSESNGNEESLEIQARYGYPETDPHVFSKKSLEWSWYERFAVGEIVHEFGG